MQSGAGPSRERPAPIRRLMIAAAAVFAAGAVEGLRRVYVLGDDGFATSLAAVIAAAAAGVLAGLALRGTRPEPAGPVEPVPAIDPRAVVELANDAIVSVDGGGRIIAFNPAAEDTFGYDVDEIIGKPLAVLLPESARAGHGAHMAAFAAAGEDSRPMGARAPIAGRRRDGSLFPCEASISCLRTGDGPLFTAIVRDVTERAKAEDALRAAKRAAELSDRAKSDFLAAMSHELRTPLNAVLGFSQLLEMDLADGRLAAEYGDYVHGIIGGGNRLLASVNDILDIADFHAGRTALRDQTVDLTLVAKAVIRRNRDAAAGAGVSLADDLPPAPVLLRGDAGRIEQLLNNLVGNAIKFNKPGGRAAIEAHRADGGGAVIAVADDGIGMDETQHAAALAEFGQGDRSLARRYEGAGLGLPLALRIAQAHGATLDIQSAPGAGTTVFVTFPADRVVPPGAGAPP